MLEGGVVLFGAKLAQPEQSPTRSGRGIKLHHASQVVPAFRISIALVFDHAESPPALGPVGTQLDGAAVKLGGLFGMIGLVGLLRFGGKVLKSLRRALRGRCRCKQKKKTYWSHFWSFLPRSCSRAWIAASISSAIFLSCRPSATRPRRK